MIKKPTSEHALLQLWALTAVQFIARPGHAQAEGDVESIISTVLASFAFIIVTILALIIYRKVSGRRRDNLYDSAGLDLMNLKNKGLLTPEEMEKVSRSIARRLEEKEAARRKAASRPTADTLLYDPEVQRLKALAEAKEAEIRRGTATHESQPPATEQVPYLQENAGEVASTTVPPTSEAIPGSDVELPPEVQQLADAGVLTPEEIETVKRRLRERQQPME